jgi:alcohol dehydrogenase
VLAFYGHRTHAVAPAGKVIPVPPRMPDDLALLAILSCDAAKGVRAAAPRYDEAALITGSGTMGILTLFMLRALGLNTVDVVEPRPERHALAARLGARRVLTPEEAERAGNAGYDVAFECSGRDAAFALLQGQTRVGARLCVLSDGNIEPLTLTPDFHRKELQVRGSSDGWDYQRHAAWFFARIGAGPHPVSDLFDLRVEAPALPDTFASIASGAIHPRKVLVIYPS